MLTEIMTFRIVVAAAPTRFTVIEKHRCSRRLTDLRSLPQELARYNMQKSQETIKQNNEPELVTVDGLQFKKYQMNLIKFLV
jgi:hypothetical protein